MCVCVVRSWCVGLVSGGPQLPRVSSPGRFGEAVPDFSQLLTFEPVHFLEILSFFRVACGSGKTGGREEVTGI